MLTPWWVAQMQAREAFNPLNPPRRENSGQKILSQKINRKFQRESFLCTSFNSDICTGNICFNLLRFIKLWSPGHTAAGLSYHFASFNKTLVTWTSLVGRPGGRQAWSVYLFTPLFMSNVNFDTLIWYFDILIFWYSETLIFWNSETLIFWDFDTLSLLYSCQSQFWYSQSIKL